MLLICIWCICCFIIWCTQIHLFRLPDILGQQHHGRAVHRPGAIGQHDHWRVFQRHQARQYLQHYTGCHAVPTHQGRPPEWGVPQVSRSSSNGYRWWWIYVWLATRATDCLSSFKKQLKTLLFKRAFSLWKNNLFNIPTFLICTIYQLFYYYYYCFIVT